MSGATLQGPGGRPAAAPAAAGGAARLAVGAGRHSSARSARRLSRSEPRAGGGVGRARSQQLGFNFLPRKKPPAPPPPMPACTPLPRSDNRVHRASSSAGGRGWGGRQPRLHLCIAHLNPGDGDSLTHHAISFVFKPAAAVFPLPFNPRTPASHQQPPHCCPCLRVLFPVARSLHPSPPGLAAGLASCSL